MTGTLLHTKKDWRVFFARHRKMVLKELHRELGRDTFNCFECFQPVADRDVCLLLDWTSLIIWCPNCTIKNMDNRLIWNKILRGGKRHGHP